MADIQEVLLINCGDKWKRPRLLSAASQALLKYCADEERQMRDFWSSGGCKGLHTPHVCLPEPHRICLPRFFAVRPRPPRLLLFQQPTTALWLWISGHVISVGPVVAADKTVLTKWSCRNCVFVKRSLAVLSSWNREYRKLLRS